jgi:hypothetical protein
MYKGGNFLIIFGASGRGNGQFENPIEIAVNPADNEYVGDNGNNHVQIFGNIEKLSYSP